MAASVPVTVVTWPTVAAVAPATGVQPRVPAPAGTVSSTRVRLWEPSTSVSAMVSESGMSVSSAPLAEPETVGASATAATRTRCVPAVVAVTPPVSVTVTATASVTFWSRLVPGVSAKLSRVARISAAEPVTV